MIAWAGFAIAVALTLPVVKLVQIATDRNAVLGLVAFLGGIAGIIGAVYGFAATVS